MAKMGRPRKELDYDKFERLCELQLTEEDMCHTFGMNSDTLNARLKEHYGLTFSEVFGQKRMGGAKFP